MWCSKANVMMPILRCLLTITLFTAAFNLHAAVAIIVNLSNYENVNEAQLRNLYLGKINTFPSGAEVKVLDLTPENSVREEFIRKVLRRSESNLNAYWARMLFSSQGRPPPMLQTPQEALSVVSRNKQAIGYMPLADVDQSRVRILMVFE